jgi:DNA polymerase-3 subunit alpha
VLIEDLHGTVEITVFSSVYTEAYHLLTEDNSILIQGQIQRDENAVKVLADAIIPMEKAEEMWTASIHFNLDVSRTDRSSLMELRDLFKRFPGSCRAVLHLRDPEKTETLIGLPETLTLGAGSALTQEVNQYLGYSAVETVCSEAIISPRNNGYSGKNRGYKGNSRNGGRRDG